MTYLELSCRKVKELISFRIETLQLSELLKGKKGYMNVAERSRYMLAVQQFHSLANDCENILRMFLSGEISPYDLVDRYR